MSMAYHIICSKITWIPYISGHREYIWASKSDIVVVCPFPQKNLGFKCRLHIAQQCSAQLLMILSWW
jgi:hypothetical protein